jgi:hypothetical protein
MNKNTSTQQRRVAVSLLRLRRRTPALPLDGLGEAMDRDGHAPELGVSVPPIVNETKLQIIAMMGVVDSPITAKELWVLWSGRKPQAIFDYHLCTLVKAGVAELVGGPELHFAFAREVGSRPFSTTYQGAVPLALVEEKQKRS